VFVIPRALRCGERLPSQAIGYPRLCAMENDGEQSSDVDLQHRTLKMVLHGCLAFILTTAGVYQFQFKLADETTLQGVLIRNQTGPSPALLGTLQTKIG
jgi:hypothetical protein